MNPTLARGLSVVLHPAIMPTYVFLVLFFGIPHLLPYEADIKWALLGAVFLSTFVVPALSVLLSYQMGLLRTLQVHDRRERVLPFVMVALMYVAIAAFFVVRADALLYVPQTMLGISVSVVLVTFITFFYKISAHATGIFGLVGVLFGLQYAEPNLQLLYYALGALLVGGLLLSARLALEAHTAGEAYWGALVGFASCFGVFYYYA